MSGPDKDSVGDGAGNRQEADPDTVGPAQPAGAPPLPGSTPPHPEATTTLPAQPQGQWAQQAWSAQPQYPQQYPGQPQYPGQQPYPGQQQYPGQPYPQYQQAPPQYPAGYPQQQYPGQPYPQYQPAPQSGQFTQPGQYPQPAQYPQQSGYPAGQYPTPTPDAPKSKLPLWIGIGALVAIAGASLVGLFAGGAGFGTTPTLDRAAAEKGVAEVLTGSYGITGVADVTCPSDRKVVEGGTFTCTLTVQDQSQKVTVTFTDGDGTYEVSRPTMR